MEARIVEIKPYKTGYTVVMSPHPQYGFKRMYGLSDALWLLSLDSHDRDALLQQLEMYQLQIMNKTFKGV